MEERFSHIRISTPDESSPKSRAFGNDGQYHNSNISQGNVFTVGGNLYMAGALAANAGADPTKADVEKFRDHLLKSLHFEEMNRRHEHVQSLVDDFGLTCQWILTPDNDHGFLSWYETAKGPFWISGLPGTGKSTLMDYIGQELPVHESWTESDVIIQHFFSSTKGSTVLQKSFEGMYRSMCHQILSNNESLLHRLMQDLPKLPILRHLPKTFIGDKNQKWTMRNLMALFRYLVDRSDNKYMLLLDGLDECDDDHEELLMKIDELVAMGVRVICSSRPDEPFAGAFARIEHVKLQNVNAEDIRNFCKVKLRNTSAFSFVEEIVDRSEGIFLWAAIVTIDLRRESRVSTVAHLTERLTQCPPGMTELYEHMLNRRLGEAHLGRHLAPYLLIIMTYIEIGMDVDILPLSPLLLLWTGVLLDDEMEDFSHITESDWLSNFVEKAGLVRGQILTSCAGFAQIIDANEDDYEYSEADDHDDIHDLDGDDPVFEACAESPGGFQSDKDGGSGHVRPDSGRMMFNLRHQRVVLVHKTAVEFLSDESTNGRLWTTWAGSKAEIVLAMVKLLISEPCKWDNALLDVMDGVSSRLWSIKKCLPVLDSHSFYRPRLYTLINHLLRNFDVPFNKQSPKDQLWITNGILAYWPYTYIPLLSEPQNLLCWWLVGRLSLAGMLENIRSPHLRECDLAGHLIFQAWCGYTGTENNEELELLSQRDDLLNKNHNFYRRYFFHEGWRWNSSLDYMLLAYKETTLWSHLMSIWLTSLSPYFKTPWILSVVESASGNLLRASTMRFIQSDPGLLKTGLPLTLRAQCADTGRHVREFMPEVDTEDGKSPKGFMHCVLGIQVVPNDVLPFEFGNETDKEIDPTDTDRPPVRFTYLRLAGSTTTIPLTSETSERFCVITNLTRNSLHDMRGVSLFQREREKAQHKHHKEFTQVVAEILRAHKHLFEDNERLLLARNLEVCDDYSDPIVVD